MFLSRLAKALGALTAIVALAGLSALPLEHVHERSDDAAHHPGVLHRHFAGHHGGAAPTSGPRSFGHKWGASDDDHPGTIQVFFTAKTRVEVRRGAWVAVESDAEIDLAPAVVDSESFVPPRRLYTSPPDIAPAVRGPPAAS